MLNIFIKTCLLLIISIWILVIFNVLNCTYGAVWEKNFKAQAKYNEKTSRTLTEHARCRKENNRLYTNFSYRPQRSNNYENRRNAKDFSYSRSYDRDYESIYDDNYVLFQRNKDPYYQSTRYSHYDDTDVSSADDDDEIPQIKHTYRRKHEDYNDLKYGHRNRQNFEDDIRKRYEDNNRRKHENNYRQKFKDSFRQKYEDSNKRRRFGNNIRHKFEDNFRQQYEDSNRRNFEFRSMENFEYSNRGNFASDDRPKFERTNMRSFDYHEIPSFDSDDRKFDDIQYAPLDDDDDDDDSSSSEDMYYSNFSLNNNLPGRGRSRYSNKGTFAYSQHERNDFPTYEDTYDDSSMKNINYVVSENNNCNIFEGDYDDEDDLSFLENNYKLPLNNRHNCYNDSYRVSHRADKDYETYDLRVMSHPSRGYISDKRLEKYMGRGNPTFVKKLPFLSTVFFVGGIIFSAFHYVVIPIICSTLSFVLTSYYIKRLKKSKKRQKLFKRRYHYIR
ncbi:Plasmodium exported protein, unknown function [Plasmodium gonderi]|uniref:Uncharacterized protein n=1 Tax=Plasmodium gonderi TaxID=77519 RepID=A0A1Y1JDW0_PLAGO|nr:Plasmodium exported protein, unknown function [Plasmodium gonderi]GAW80440.1 Plasmodium exported protein, unknown function [Plasmodium gonderi]